MLMMMISMFMTTALMLVAITTFFFLARASRGQLPRKRGLLQKARSEKKYCRQRQAQRLPPEAGPEAGAKD